MILNCIYRPIQYSTVQIWIYNTVCSWQHSTTQSALVKSSAQLIDSDPINIPSIPFIQSNPTIYCCDQHQPSFQQVCIDIMDSLCIVTFIMVFLTPQQRNAGKSSLMCWIIPSQCKPPSCCKPVQRTSYNYQSNTTKIL